MFYSEILWNRSGVRVTKIPIKDSGGLFLNLLDYFVMVVNPWDSKRGAPPNSERMLIKFVARPEILHFQRRCPPWTCWLLILFTSKKLSLRKSIVPAVPNMSSRMVTSPLPPGTDSSWLNHYSAWSNIAGDDMLVVTCCSSTCKCVPLIDLVLWWSKFRAQPPQVLFGKILSGCQSFPIIGYRSLKSNIERLTNLQIQDRWKE